MSRRFIYALIALVFAFLALALIPVVMMAIQGGHP